MRISNLKSKIRNFFIALLVVCGLTFGLSQASQSGSRIESGMTMGVVNSTLIPSVHASASTDLSKGGLGLTISQDNVKISSAISQKSFGSTLIAMVNYFIGFLGFLATLAFVYAGVLWVVSAGNEEMTTKAKKILMYAILGILVVILSYSAVVFITKSAYKAGGPTVGGTSLSCVADKDCSSGSSCVSGKCIGSSTVSQKGAVKGTVSKPAFSSNMTKLDTLTNTLDSDLGTSKLSTATKKKVTTAVSTGDITQKITNLKNTATSTTMTTTEVGTVQKIINALESLKAIRKELDTLYKNMPKSKATEEAYKDTSNALNSLMSDPTNRVKSSLFIGKYKKLKDLISKFPVVKASITAFPGGGNVPFTVQFDGLNSSDPTGGTIGKYNWSYLDSSGNEVSLGSKPVVIHPFNTVNTYVVRLRVSTSNVDADGYKKAADGISTVRIKANPPNSKVKFRINGIDAEDSATVTLKEAKTGVSFDPSTTVPALGRTIVKYKWAYGDTFDETRLVPTTVIHNYPKVGEYYVTLSVTDNIGITDKKIVKLFVKSLAADVKITPKTGNVNTTFKFEGTGSRSDNGTITKYDWNITDGVGKSVKTNTNKTFNYRFDSPGNYKVTLLATDTTSAVDKVIKDVKIVSRAPIANFNYKTPEINHPNTLDFSAVDSYDPDRGDTLTYSWDFDGDGTFEIVDSSKTSATYKYYRIGDYKAKLQVKDAFGKTSQSVKKIVIKSILSADISVKTLTVRVGDSMTFSVANSNATGYLWEFGDSTKNSTEKTSIAHKYNKTGKFAVKLHFFDKNNNSNYDTVTVLVGPSDAPIASISYTVNGREAHAVTNLCGTGREGLVVTRADKLGFSAKNSLNTDGSTRLLSYDWRFPGGEKSSYKETQFKFSDLNKEGECFKATLAVRDQVTGKLSAKDTVYFKVKNKLPTVTDFVITPSTTITLPVGSALTSSTSSTSTSSTAGTFTSSSTSSTSSKVTATTPTKVKLAVISPYDGDGVVKKYKWWYHLDGFPSQKFGVHSTDTSYTTMTITSYGKTGATNRYYFVGEAIDNDGGVYNTKEKFGGVSYMDVKNGKNMEPIAEFTMDKTTISAGESITFMSKSYDPQGEDLPKSAFRWDFDGDGDFDDISSGAQIKHKYSTPGEYKVVLRVINRGLSATKTRTIYVETTQSLPHAAFTYTVKGNTVTFDGSHTASDLTLKDTAVKFSWDFDTATDADANSIKDDDVQSTKIKPSFTYSSKGIYKVRLQVTDSAGKKGILVRNIDLNMTEAQRKKDTYRSLRVGSNKNALTTLDIETNPISPKKNGSMDIKVRVINADGSTYSGKVYFGLLEGSGSFTPNPVTAVNSQATAIFQASDSGKVTIRIRATNTIYGDIKEDLIINVK